MIIYPKPVREVGDNRNTISIPLTWIDIFHHQHISLRGCHSMVVVGIQSNPAKPSLSRQTHGQKDRPWCHWRDILIHFHSTPRLDSYPIDYSLVPFSGLYLSLVQLLCDATLLPINVSILVIDPYNIHGNITSYQPTTRTIQQVLDGVW